MTHNLIKTEHYLLIVDDSKIKDGDWCIEGDVIGKVYDYDNNQDSYDCWIGDSLNGYATYYDSFQKIIAHLPLNNAPVLEGVDLLPPLSEQILDEMLKSIFGETDGSNIHIREVFMMGYKKAKENYKYTEEDMRIAYNSGKRGGKTENYYEFEEVLQLVQQPKLPIAFERAVDYIGFQEEGDIEEFRTYKNKLGQTVWDGRYIHFVKVFNHD